MSLTIEQLAELRRAAEAATPGTGSREKGDEAMKIQRFNVGDVIRMPHYDTAGGPILKRVWKIHGEHLGATHQEGTYHLVPLDYEKNEPIHVPCVMLESHPLVDRV